MRTRLFITFFLIALLAHGRLADASFVLFPLPTLVSNALAIVEGRVMAVSRSDYDDGVYKYSWILAIDQYIHRTLPTSDWSDGTNNYTVIIAVTLDGPKVPTGMWRDLRVGDDGIWFIVKSHIGTNEYEIVRTTHSLQSIKDEIESRPNKAVEGMAPR